MNFLHEDLAIMDNLIGAIVNSDAWDREQQQNPEILTASDKMDAALDRIRGIVPDEAIGQIEDAALDYASLNFVACKWKKAPTAMNILPLKALKY